MKSKKSKHFNKSLGAVIRVERKARGWSMNDVAEMMGYSYQQQQKNEYGINGLSAHQVARMAEIFQIPVAQLYERAHGDVALPVGKSMPEDNDAFLVSRYTKRIADGKVRQALIDFTRKLAYEGARA